MSSNKFSAAGLYDGLIKVLALVGLLPRAKGELVESFLLDRETGFSYLVSGELGSPVTAPTLLIPRFGRGKVTMTGMVTQTNHQIRFVYWDELGRLIQNFYQGHIRTVSHQEMEEDALLFAWLCGEEAEDKMVSIAIHVFGCAGCLGEFLSTLGVSALLAESLNQEVVPGGGVTAGDLMEAHLNELEERFRGNGPPRQ